MFKQSTEKKYDLLVANKTELAERRAKVNTTFLSLHTAVLGIIGYSITQMDIIPGKFHEYIPVIACVPVCGFLVSVMWLAIVDYYLAEQSLIQDQIEELERRFVFRPYSMINEKLQKAETAPSFQLTFYGIPLIFLNIYWLMTFSTLLPPVKGHYLPIVILIILIVPTVIFNVLVLGVVRTPFGVELKSWVTRHYLAVTAFYLMAVILLSYHWLTLGIGPFELIFYSFNCYRVESILVTIFFVLSILFLVRYDLSSVHKARMQTGKTPDVSPSQDDRISLKPYAYKLFLLSLIILSVSSIHLFLKLSDDEQNNLIKNKCKEFSCGLKEIANELKIVGQEENKNLPLSERQHHIVRKVILKEYSMKPIIEKLENNLQEKEVKMKQQANEIAVLNSKIDELISKKHVGKLLTANEELKELVKGIKDSGKKVSDNQHELKTLESPIGNVLMTLTDEEQPSMSKQSEANTKNVEQ